MTRKSGLELPLGTRHANPEFEDWLKDGKSSNLDKESFTRAAGCLKFTPDARKEFFISRAARFTLMEDILMPLIWLKGANL